MPKPLDAFEERLYKEYDLKGRVRQAIVISIVLFIGFLFLDWIYTPQYLEIFAIIRFSVAALEIVLLLIARRLQSNRGFINLAMIMVFADAVGIGIMVQILGGFLTSYYQGLNIIVMGMLVVIPFAFRESLILYALTWAVYAVPSFGKVLAGQDPLIVDGRAVELWRFVVNNLFFLTSIIFVGAYGSKIMDSNRRRELRNRSRNRTSSSRASTSSRPSSSPTSTTSSGRR
jgi:hypothetical protein